MLNEVTVGKSNTALETQRTALGESSFKCFADARTTSDEKQCHFDSRTKWKSHIEDLYERKDLDSRNTSVNSPLKRTAQKWNDFIAKEDLLVAVVDKVSHPDSLTAALAADSFVSYTARSMQTGYIRGYRADAITMACIQNNALDSADKNKCMSSSIGKLEQFIDKELEELKRALPAHKDLVQNSQDSWMEFQNAQSIYLDSIFPSTGDSHSVDAFKAKHKAYVLRANELHYLNKATLGQ